MFCDIKSDSLIKWVRDNSLYVFCFIFMFWVLHKIPPVNDSWFGSKTYMNYGGICGYFSYTIRWWNQVNGRISALLVTGFFERSQLLVDFVNAALLTGIAYLNNRLFNTNNNRLAKLASVAFLFMVSPGLRIEVYFYAAMMYLVPVFLLLLVLYLYRDYQDHDRSYAGLWIAIVLGASFLLSSWVENTSLAYALSFLVLSAFDFFKTGKFKKLSLAINIANLTGLSLLLASPGLPKSRELIAKQNGVIDTIFYQMQYFGRELLFRNALLVMLLIIAACICVIINRHKLNKKIFIISAVFLASLALLWFAHFLPREFVEPIIGKGKEGLLDRMLLMSSPRFLTGKGIVSYIRYSFFPVFYSLSVLMLFFMIWRISANRFVVFMAAMIAMSIAPLMVSRNNGARISSVAVFCFISIIICLFSEIAVTRRVLNTVMYCSFVVLFLFSLDNYAVIAKSIEAIQKERDTIISAVREKQLLGEWDYNKVVTLPPFSAEHLYCGASPQKGFFHYGPFLEYYSLHPGTVVAFNNSKDVLHVTFTEKNMAILTVDPAVNTVAYNYRYFVTKNEHSKVFESEISSESSLAIDLPQEPGTYLFKCTLTDEQGKSLTISSADMYVVP